jgi:hypothetical protein
MATLKEETEVNFGGAQGMTKMMTVSRSRGPPGSASQNVFSGPSVRRNDMSHESRRVSGVLLILMPTVAFGGVSSLSLLVVAPHTRRMHSARDLWRAGHVHAGVRLMFSLITLRYVDEAQLSEHLN